MRNDNKFFLTFLIQVWITLALLTKMTLYKETKIMKKMLPCILEYKLKLSIENAKRY